MREVSIIIFLLTVGCTNQKTTIEQTVSTVGQSSEPIEIIPTDEQKTQITLTDTALNGHTVKFYELTTKAFDSLQRQVNRTEINLMSADNQAKKLDSCFIIKFQN